jgi:hypothetical protein
MKKKVIKIKKERPRNPFALEAKKRKAGRHKDRRRERNKKLCRCKVKEE